MFSGRSFIDFQGGALRAPPRENRPLPDVGFERVKRVPKIVFDVVHDAVLDAVLYAVLDVALDDGY